MRRLFKTILLLGMLAIPFDSHAAELRTVTLPITLDYPFIQAMLKNQAYQAPGGRALAASSENGCTKVEMWDPEVDQDQGYLRHTSRIKVKAGFTVLGHCIDPIEWQGKIRVWQKVRLDPKTWRIRVATVKSELYTDDMHPADVANTVLDLVEEHVHAYLDQFSVNLAPPKKDLMVQLPLLFKPEVRKQVDKWLASLRPLNVRVDNDALKISLIMDVDYEPIREKALKTPVTEPLTDEQKDNFIRYWEAWDSFLIHQILTLSDKPLTAAEKTEIASAVLDMRYDFVKALEEPTAERDLVRMHYLTTWRRLSPIFRKHMTGESTPSLFNYLAFFTASDALAVLDELGPGIGLEISREGLLRLARLVNRDKVYPSLEYSYEVNRKLRELLGLGDEHKTGHPLFKGHELRLKEDQGGGDEPEPDTSYRFLDWFASPAYAAGPPTNPTLKAIRTWLPPQENHAQYVKRVMKLLDTCIGRVLKKDDLPETLHRFFNHTVIASAWQESCWRQFIIKGGKITYLLSYNHTSVGLMQINQRVWRGIYDPHSLRWDIEYNATAGCEILLLYLNRYVLSKTKNGEEFHHDKTAGLLYAMYNGGPSQYKKFLKRDKIGKLGMTDRLFAQKYQWTTSGNMHNAVICLGGSIDEAAQALRRR